MTESHTADYQSRAPAPEPVGDQTRPQRDAQRTSQRMRVVSMDNRATVRWNTGHRLDGFDTGEEQRHEQHIEQLRAEHQRPERHLRFLRFDARGESEVSGDHLYDLPRDASSFFRPCEP